MLAGGWFAWRHHRQDTTSATASPSASSDWQKRPPAAARKIAASPVQPRSVPEIGAPPSAEALAPVAAPANDGTPAANSSSTTAPDATALENYYNGLFHRLSFTPEQVALFRSLRDQAILDAVNALPPAERERLASNPATLRQMVFTSDTGLDARILQQFGDVVYTQYKQDQQTFPQRVTVDQFDQMLHSAGSGLSDEQANQLVQILAHTETSSPKSDTTRISPDALNAAAAVLTPEQLQALQQFQAAQPPVQP